MYIQSILAVLAGEGHDIDEFTRQSALFRNVPMGRRLEAVEVEFDQYLSLVSEVMDRFGDNGLGLKIGQRFQASSLGVLGFALISSRDLHSAVKLAERYQVLWGGASYLHWHYEVSGAQPYMEVSNNIPPERMQRFMLEDACAQFLCARDLLERPERFRIVRAEFPFPPPDHASAYEDVFRCPVKFNQAICRLYLPKHLMRERFSSNNPTVREICQAQCDRLQLIQDRQGGVLEKVRAIILNSTHVVPRMSDVASELNMSERTLRRHLFAEGVTFKQVAGDIRMRMARQYLEETPLSTKEIAYLLKFSDVASFQRAFKNWFQVTPAELRRQQSPPNA